jgi:two component regulator with propeller domain
LTYTFDLDTNLVYDGLGSNAITDIVQMNDSTFLFASGNGLSISYNRGEKIQTFYPSGETVSYGAVTGLITLGENIWVATAYDTSVLEGSYYTDYPKGNGISYSPDAGQTWQRFPQSVDAQYDTLEAIYDDSIPALPITSKINNLTYDLAIQLTAAGDTVLWSANFAGGCRKSYDHGETWQRVVLPPDRYNSLNIDTPLDFDLSPTSGALGYESNLNHRAFSLSIVGDTVIVGTANGINISYDEGVTWTKYTAQNSGIVGNFIVDLTQASDGTIFGVALSTQSTENKGLVVSNRNANGMLFWETQLEGTRLYNVYSRHADHAYASGEEGFWYSADGWNWVDMGNIQDINGQLLLTEKIYCVYEDTQNELWVGSADGVARSTDLGLSWEIIRRVSNDDIEEDLTLSAYPNPFSPSRMNQLGDEGYVRVHCQLPSPGRVNIEIFDYSMKRVKNLVENVSVSNSIVEFTWNGRNGLNDLVANGVYFIRLEYDFGDGDGKQIAWTKLIVLD